MKQTLVSRLRLPGVLCAVALLVCVLAAHPFAEIGISDDWSYVRTAGILAATGKVVYNGWATAMIGWQLFPAAWFMKLFGATYLSARMTTLIVAALTAFLVQRTMVRVGLNERNAVLGTLALVLGPVYMQLSATFMTDIGGMLAVVLCLYGCVRAVRAATAAGAAWWLCGAALSNAVLGSSRQIAWLGLLVMVPATLWLLTRRWTSGQDRRALLLPPVVAIVAGCLAVRWSLHWFAAQPYALVEHLTPDIHGMDSVVQGVRELVRATFELPLLLVAVLAAFIPESRRLGRRFWGIFAALAAVVLVVGVRQAMHHSLGGMLEPPLGDWIGPQGMYEYTLLASEGPVALGIPARLLLTVVTLFGAYSAIGFLLHLRAERLQPVAVADARGALSWDELAWVVGPFTLAYAALLIPRSTRQLVDRYLLELALVGLICLIRLYQEFVRPALPRITVAVVAVIALYSVGSVHDLFALGRAKLALDQELRADGVPSTVVDEGFELNGMNELALAGYLDDERLTNPPGAYYPLDRYRGMSCTGKEDLVMGEAHLVPQYGFAFDQKACAGQAGFAPVSYRSWLVMRRVNLYVVRFVPHQQK